MTAQDQTPDRLGPYRLLDRLGEGGMGVVYLAADPQQRRVAVKALRPAFAADPNARRRLAREVETMRRVRSPFVAEVLDADVTSDPPYIVTRYVSGRTLEEVVGEGGPLAGRELARLASGLALALSAVHAAGVVHRDLKPGNVMIANGEPVVIDFGIAQVPDSTRLTQTGMFMGTPGYLAPEVIEGQPSGPPSDVHSWGATVAFAATGRPPFGTGAFETIFYRIVNGQPDLAGFPAPLLSLVAQALSRNPARRPDTAELCRRTAALDPSSLVPAAAAAAGAAPFLPPGTVADRPGPSALAGGRARVGPPPVGPVGVWPPATTPWPTGNGGATGNPAGNGGGLGNGGFSGPGTRAADDYRDVLPPVRYPPPGTPPPSAQGAAGGAGAAGSAGADAPAARSSSRSPVGPLLVVTSLAAAVVISIVYPVAGTIASLAALIGLRAADRTVRRLSRRRSSRGARAGDVLLAAVTFPPALAWSLIRSVLLAPMALVAAVIVAAIAVAAAPHRPIAVPVGYACAYGAGALVAFYGLGPGSGGSRRPIRGLFDTVARTPVRSAVAFIALAVVVIAGVVAAARNAPVFWPISHLNVSLGNYHIVHVVVENTRAKISRLFGRPSG
jgi:predicted Ser/Thr protein kinase